MTYPRRNVASCWFANILAMHGPVNVKFEVYPTGCVVLCCQIAMKTILCPQCHAESCIQVQCWTKRETLKLYKDKLNNIST